MSPSLLGDCFTYILYLSEPQWSLSITSSSQWTSRQLWDSVFLIFLRWALPSTKWSSLEFEVLGVLPQIDPRHIEFNRTSNVELAIRPCDRISLRPLKHCQLPCVGHAKHAQRGHSPRGVHRFSVDKAFTWIELIVTIQEAGLQHQIV